jgi:hypothetical protein
MVLTREGILVKHTNDVKPQRSFWVLPSCYLNTEQILKATDDSGSPPIWRAADSGKLEVLNLLIDSGSDMAVEDSSG